MGPSCGHHASYAFYKAIRYTHKKTGAPKILSLGEFFFVKGRIDDGLIPRDSCRNMATTQVPFLWAHACYINVA